MTHANVQRAPQWAYRSPTTVSELLTTAAAAGNEAVFIAGGQSLLPHIARRAISNGCLIDVSRIDELRRITIAPGRVELGAAVTFNEILLSDVSTAFPALAQALRCVGTHTIRNRATVGGSLAWADPRAELPLALLAHDAHVRTSHREIAIQELLRGPFQCALAPGEVILGIRITADNRARRGFAQLLDRNSAGKAMVSVSLALQADTDAVSWCLAVGALADRPVISPTMHFAANAASGEHEMAMRRWLERICSEHSLLADPFHSAKYRCDMALVLARRLQRNLQS